MATEHPVILHHFPQSPFSEKIRLIFGLKKIAWTSVEISRIMPRPDLMPMTGGYRRTPVMQIGADIYCDTQCIMRELERRFPEPTLFPEGYRGLASATAMWTDKAFFQGIVNLVFGTLADKVPQDFIADREKLRGAKFDVAAMTSAIPQMRDQFRAHLQWIDAQLGRWPELFVRRPGQPLRHQRLHERLVRSQQPSLRPRPDARRISGHEELGSADARDRAWHVRRTCRHRRRWRSVPAPRPQTAELADLHDPNGRKPGDQVQVMPDDYGKIGVRGEIVALSSQHIAIRRHDPIAGEIVVHFPRAGFLVLPV